MHNAPLPSLAVTPALFFFPHLSSTMQRNAMPGAKPPAVDLKSGTAVLRELVRIRSVEDFWPSRNEARETNAMRILRLIFVVSVLLALLLSSIAVMVLPIVFFLIFFAYTRIETYEGTSATPECTQPTVDNPYMNALYGDPPERPPACKHAAQVSREMYYATLPRDADDLHNTRATDWAFYTTANTQNPSDQDEFLRFLGAGPKPDWATEKQTTLKN